MRTHMKMVVAILFIVLSISACGGKQAPTPTSAPPAAVQQATKATPAKAPAAKAEATSTPGSQGPISFKLAVGNTNTKWKSYREHFVYHIQIPAKNIDMNVLDMSISATQNPSAEHVIMISRSTPQDQPTRVEVVRVGQKVWMHAGDTWMRSTTDTNQSFAQATQSFNPDQMGRDWKNVGKETVNGLDTIHYQSHVSEGASSHLVADEGTLNQILPPQGGKPWTFKLNSVTGDVYATENALVVKEDIVWNLTATNGNESVPITQENMYEISDINSDFTIEVPKEAQGPKEIVPLPKGAQLQSSLGELRIYAIPNTTIEKVAKFLVNALPAKGFTIEKQNTMGGVATLSVKKGDKVLSLRAMPGYNGSVKLFVQPQ